MKTTTLTATKATDRPCHANQWNHNKENENPERANWKEKKKKHQLNKRERNII